MSHRSVGGLKHLKILVDAHYFDANPQGVTTYIRGLYLSVYKLAPEIEIIFFAETDKIYRDYPELAEISRLELVVGRGVLGRLLVDIPRLSRKHKVDFVHTQYIMSPISFGKTVVTIHDILFMRFPEEYTFFYRFSRKLLFGFAAKNCDVLVTSSSYSKRELECFFGLDKGSALVAPCGVNDSNMLNSKEHAQRNVAERFGIDGRYLLYVSRFEPRKNHAALLRAFYASDAYKKGLKVVFVGGKSMSVPEYDLFVGSLSADDRSRIFELSGVSDGELSDLYRAADVFAYPSLSEGFGIPPLEAAIHLTPTVCSNLTAMEDFDFFGKCHIDPRDVKMLQASIDESINMVSLEALVEIQAWVLSAYTWEISAELFIARLRSAI